MRRFLVSVWLPFLLAPPATATEAVDAVWNEHEVDFRFLGLETAYTCDAMESKITMLLRHVGGNDIQVKVPTCGGFMFPQRNHRILATFSTLCTAGEGDGDIVKATWSEVELGRGRPRSIDDQDCELLEHFQKHLLVTIEHEVIDGTVACGASRRSIAGRLKLKVLKTVPADDATKNDD
jgi:hypothetical protein